MNENLALDLLQHLSGAVNARDAFLRLLDRCRERSRADGAAALRAHRSRPGHELVMTLGLPVKEDYVFATTIDNGDITKDEVSRNGGAFLFQDTKCSANLRVGESAVIHLEWQDPESMALATLKELKDAFTYTAPMVKHLQQYDSRISVQSSQGEFRPEEADLELDVPEPKSLFRRIYGLLSTRIKLDGAAFMLAGNGEIAHFGKIKPVEKLSDDAIPIRFKDQEIGAAMLKGAKAEDLDRAKEVLDQAALFLKKAVLYRATKAKNAASPLLLVGVPRDVLELSEAYADAEAPILVRGETGTGKESVARYIHMIGSRRDKPFQPFNCAELVESLAESQLFGHARGAFTGAVSATQGIFEQAHGGTLFLDEIHLLTPPLQAKFLRAIETGEIRPVGSSGPPRKLDVRIIVATNRDLMEMVGEGTFLHDLYMRLDVLEVTIPSLRLNRGTILKLATALLTEIAERNRKKIDGFTPRAKQALFLYDYPGNIRELKNILEKAVVTSKGSVIDVTSLPKKMLNLKPRNGPVTDGEFDPHYETHKSMMERTYLVRLLERASGNVAEASRLAGLHRTHIYNLMKKHKITAQQFKG